MPILAALEVRTLTAALLAHMRAVQPLLPMYEGAVEKAPVAGDGRARPFAVVYPSPGSVDDDRITGTMHGLVWVFQVTCAGGDVTRALAAVDAVRGILAGERVPIAGGYSGRCKEIGNGGPVTEDRDGSPTRWSTALIYSLHVTRRSTL